jgi:uncharacterized membrane protein
MATDQVSISGEYAALLVATKAIAATRKFDFTLSIKTYGGFVARGTSKWEQNFAGALGATFEVDGLVVTQAPSPDANRFSDLFTAAIARTAVAVVFTLKTATTGEPQFIYAASAVIKDLKSSAPQFGEATYTCSLIVTGAVAQTIGTIS